MITVLIRIMHSSHWNILSFQKGSGITSQKKLKRILLQGIIFGRGIMDMKFGIALDVEIMHQIESKFDNFPKYPITVSS